MIISHGRGYIFVHIPKTGGTSMALALEERAMKDDILIGDTPKAQRRKGRLKDVRTAGRLWKHSTLADVEGLITRDEMSAMFVFTLVRNPWDRLVSYYHWLQEQSFDHPAVGLAQRLSFADFLNTPDIQSSFAAAPYASYLRDGAGMQRANHFIRLEHLDEDLPRLENHLGFSIDLPHANRSPRAGQYRGYYSDADAEIVAQVCAQDIASFGYRF